MDTGRVGRVNFLNQTLMNLPPRLLLPAFSLCLLFGHALGAAAPKPYFIFINIDELGSGSMGSGSRAPGKVTDAAPILDFEGQVRKVLQPPAKVSP